MRFSLGGKRGGDSDRAGLGNGNGNGNVSADRLPAPSSAQDDWQVSGADHPTSVAAPAPTAPAASPAAESGRGADVPAPLSSADPPTLIGERRGSASDGNGRPDGNAQGEAGAAGGAPGLSGG